MVDSFDKTIEYLQNQIEIQKISISLISNQINNLYKMKKTYVQAIENLKEKLIKCLKEENKKNDL